MSRCLSGFFFSDSLRPLSTRPTLMVEGAWTPESASAPEIPYTLAVLYPETHQHSQSALTRLLPKYLWSKQQRADQYSDGLCVPCNLLGTFQRGITTAWLSGRWGTQILPKPGIPVFRERSHCEPTMHRAHWLSLKTQFNCRLLFLPSQCGWIYKKRISNYWETLSTASKIPVWPWIKSMLRHKFQRPSKGCNNLASSCRTRGTPCTEPGSLRLEPDISELLLKRLSKWSQVRVCIYDWALI